MIYEIDFTGVEGKDDFYSALEQALPLPPYCGRNLDALHDVMSDAVDWDIILLGWDALEEAMPHYADSFRNMLEDAAQSNPGFHCHIGDRQEDGGQAGPDDNTVIGRGLTAELGIRFTERVPGVSCTGEMPVGEKQKNFFGIVHGGAFFTLADTVCGFAASTLDRRITTVESSFRFLSAGKNCEKVICHGTVDKKGKNLIWVNALLEDENKKPLCKGEFLYYVLDGKEF